MAKSKLFILFVVILCAVCLPLEIWAKRTAPDPVKPVFQGSCKIQATGTGSSGKVVVSKRCKCFYKPKIFTIYEINYLKSLENDVQDLHITKLEIDKDLLIVKTEKGGIFSCNIPTGKVKLIKLPQGYELIPTTASVIKLKVKR